MISKGRGLNTFKLDRRRRTRRWAALTDVFSCAGEQRWTAAELAYAPPMAVGRLGRILCLEGDSEADLTSATSVRPMLELLRDVADVEFVHKDIGTRTELEHYLRRWTTDDSSVEQFLTLYIALHGTKKASLSGWERALIISHADDGVVSLRELATMLGDGLAGVVVHLGSCSVLKEEEKLLKDFCRTTGIAALAGYTTDVEWMPSAALDLLFFSSIAPYSRWSAAAAAWERQAVVTKSLRRSLGFRIITSST